MFLVDVTRGGGAGEGAEDVGDGDDPDPKLDAGGLTLETSPRAASGE